jgi:hypothetical protein
VLAGLRLWPIVIHTLFGLSGLATAKHDASGPSDAFKTKVTRTVFLAACVWFCFFSSIAVLLGYMATNPGGWVALFLGIALTSCLAVANYFLALRRLRTAGKTKADAGITKQPSKVRKFAKWASSSLVGHIVLFQICGALPMFILFMYLNYSEDTLTLSWAIWIAFVAECFGIFMALLMWFTLSRWSVYLRRDADAMKALLAKKRQ